MNKEVVIGQLKFVKDCIKSIVENKDVFQAYYCFEILDMVISQSAIFSNNPIEKELFTMASRIACRLYLELNVPKDLEKELKIANDFINKLESLIQSNVDIQEVKNVCNNL